MITLSPLEPFALSRMVSATVLGKTVLGLILGKLGKLRLYFNSQSTIHKGISRDCKRCVVFSIIEIQI